ncbi:jg22578 [Pararge aegeria aegeria]|uniref:Jg22578 protein n=1 Tax=Pararge aegeria aegeria TaxID=348720 RepID=A0A8S4QQV7_9NEOP|nr:jg22578 [Pararge aegeria aegeria]
MGAYHLRADNASGPTQVRPRPVVVRLARWELRNDMLRSARVRREVTTADLGMSNEPRRFYVNERLTKHNRYLFRKTREAAKERNWKFVWTRRGRTYARREQGSSAIQLSCEDDIDRLTIAK